MLQMITDNHHLKKASATQLQLILEKKKMPE